METFSDAFLARHRAHLLYYGLRWTHDPLHDPTRQWEYPFTLERLRAAEPMRVLDAGSGVTFFPYYLQNELEGCRVTCCDYDRYAASRYPLLNRGEAGAPVVFERGDLRELPFEAGSFDAIYTISVLEHTNDYAAVLDEFHRVLRPAGTLIVTFDVSLDGHKDIPVPAARELLELLASRFAVKDSPALSPDEAVYTSDQGDLCVPARPLWDGYRRAVRLGKALVGKRVVPSAMTFYCGEYARL